MAHLAVGSKFANERGCAGLSKRQLIWFLNPNNARKAHVSAKSESESARSVSPLSCWLTMRADIVLFSIEM